MNQAHPVQVEFKSVYGTLLIYPVNEEAKIFAALTGKKTMSKIDLELIKALGHDVVQVSTNHLGA